MSRPTSRRILWEVLAPFIRWPMHSPRRFLLVVTVAAVALVVIARGGSSDPPAEAASTSTPNVSATTSSGGGDIPSPPSRSSPAPSSTSPAPPPTLSAPVLPPAAMQAAQQFLTAWARPDQPQQEWYAALEPMSTPALAKGLAAADPRNVPASMVIGALDPVEVSPNLQAPTRAVLVADTDAGPMAVTVTLSSSTWLVERIAPQDIPDEV